MSTLPPSPRTVSGPAFLFGTVGVPISTPKRPGGTVGGVERSARLHLHALELAWVQSVRVTEAKCAEIRATAERHMVALSVHAPYYINLNASLEEWPKGRQRLMDAAHYGNLAGASEIIFHPGSYFGSPAAEVLKRALPRLRGCIEELRRDGNFVTLRPETMGKSAMLGSLEDTLAMSSEVPGVLPCLDFAHLFARAADGSANSYEEWRRMLARVEAVLGPAAIGNLHIHLSGIAYGPKGEKHHLVLGRSKLLYRELLRALFDAGCSGRLLCESPAMERDARLLQRAWADLFSTLL